MTCIATSLTIIRYFEDLNAADCADVLLNVAEGEDVSEDLHL